MQKPKYMQKLIHSITKKSLQIFCKAENVIRKWKEKWLTGKNTCNQYYKG